MSTKEEIELDLEEMTRLQELAVRPRVKDILSLEINKLKNLDKQPTSTSDASKKLETAAAAACISSAPLKTAVTPTKYYKDITTYAWDQSDKFMKLYVTVDGVQNLPKENITTEFKNKSFRLRVENLNGVNYQCHVAYLWDNIIPSDSYHKVKSDSVLVMLKKAEEKKTWAYFTEREDKKKKTPKLDEQKDPNDSLMDLLKQMYEDGDDEMRRTIAKSFSESKNKTPMDV